MKRFIAILSFILFTVSSVFAEIEVTCSDKWKTHQHSDKEYFELCYIDELKVPEYVYWNLTCDETEDVVKRSGSFVMDKTIPNGTASTSDYTNSGYDRGHMAPVEDFKFNPNAMELTFLMSNIAPQLPSYNRGGAWREAEMLGEIYAVNYINVDIVTGPVFINDITYIGNKNKIAVPDGFFRIFYNKEVGLLEAYVIYQDNYSKGLDSYRTTIDRIEDLTGLKFIFK